MSSTYYQFEARNYSMGRGLTQACQRLILINVAVFIAQLFVLIPLGSSPVIDALGQSFFHLDAINTPLASFVGFHPELFLGISTKVYPEFLQGIPFLWQPFTYMFLHQGLWHLFVNMLMLFFLGPEVERTLSTRKFYQFYFFCGVLAIFVEMAAWGIGLTPQAALVVGASGATYGVLIAFAMSRPQSDLIPFPLPFPINVKTIVIFAIFMNMIMWIMGSAYAVFTHFGGMGAGWLYMKGAPKLLAWREDRRERRAKKKMDHVGDAVDNIFQFDPKDKKH